MTARLRPDFGRRHPSHAARGRALYPDRHGDPRLAPNVSDEHRESLTTIYGEQFRVYLREMGIDTELLDIVDRNNERRHATEVPPSDWTRLHIVTTASQSPMR
ncbi:hypothetical protein [Bradyrhizobium sp.]|uniref:hypothetical protein n=1 Tax=Bradyrhizobium sp. TaxID=376 RepID=UPI003C37DDD3